MLVYCPYRRGMAPILHLLAHIDEIFSRMSNLSGFKVVIVVDIVEYHVVAAIPQERIVLILVCPQPIFAPAQTPTKHIHLHRVVAVHAQAQSYHIVAYLQYLIVVGCLGACVEWCAAIGVTLAHYVDKPLGCHLPTRRTRVIKALPSVSAQIPPARIVPVGSQWVSICHSPTLNNTLSVSPATSSQVLNSATVTKSNALANMRATDFSIFSLGFFFLAAKITSLLSIHWYLPAH